MVAAFRSVSAVSSSASAASPALPASIQVDDILLLFWETSNQNASAAPSATVGTWAEVTNSPQGTGTAGTSGSGVGLRVFWSRVVSGSTAPTMSDSGDHNYAYIAAYSGCINSGNPWDITAGGVESTSDTSGSATGVTTAADNELVVVCAAAATDTTSAQISTFTNANLSNLTFRQGTQIQTGSGGGCYICDGTKAAAGATGATTYTQAGSSPKAFLTIALKNAAVVTTVYPDSADGAGAAYDPALSLAYGASSADGTGTAPGASIPPSSVASVDTVLIGVRYTPATAVTPPAADGGGFAYTAEVTALAVALPDAATGTGQAPDPAAAAAATVTPPAADGADGTYAAAVTTSGTALPPQADGPGAASDATVTAVGTGIPASADGAGFVYDAAVITASTVTPASADGAGTAYDGTPAYGGGALAPPWVGTAAGVTSGATSVTLDFTAAATGDWLYAAVGLSDAQAAAPSAPAGWSILKQGSEGTTGSNSSCLTVYTRRKQAGDTTQAFTWGTSCGYAALPFSYPGDATTPAEGAIYQAHSSGSSFPTGSVTPAGTNRWITGVFYLRGSTATGTWTPDAAMTERDDHAFGTNPYSILELADTGGTVTQAGHTYTSTCTTTSSHGGSIAWALIPGAAPSGTTVTPLSAESAGQAPDAQPTAGTVVTPAQAGVAGESLDAAITAASDAWPAHASGAGTAYDAQPVTAGSVASVDTVAVSVEYSPAPPGTVTVTPDAATGTGECPFQAGFSASLNLIADDAVDGTGQAYDAVPSTATFATVTAAQADGAGFACNAAPSVSGSASAGSADGTGQAGDAPPSACQWFPAGANANPDFADGSTTGWSGFHGALTGSTSPPAGCPRGSAGQYVNDGISTGAIEGSPAPFPASPGVRHLITASVWTSGTTAVRIGFDWTDSAHGYLSTTTANITVPAGAWTDVTAIVTAPANAVYGYARVGSDTLSATTWATAILSWTAAVPASAAVTAGQAPDTTVTAAGAATPGSGDGAGTAYDALPVTAGTTYVQPAQADGAAQACDSAVSGSGTGTPASADGTGQGLDAGATSASAVAPAPAGGTGTAYDATAAITAAGQVTAAPADGAGQAPDAAYAASGTATADAAAAPGQALDATPATASYTTVTPAAADGTGNAYQPGWAATGTVLPAQADGAGQSYDAAAGGSGVTAAGLAAAAGAALDAQPAYGRLVLPGTADSTGTANDAAASITIALEAAEAAAQALDVYIPPQVVFGKSVPGTGTADHASADGSVVNGAAAGGILVGSGTPGSG